MAKPLDGVRVLDLSKVLAGPLCAQYLGDLGAEVIKVEAVGQGDETRGWPPFPAPGLGTVFLSANRNKRSIAINMKSEKGRALVHELAKSADVAIESFGTGVAERLANRCRQPSRAERSADPLQHLRIRPFRAAEEFTGLRRDPAGLQRHHVDDGG